MLRSQRQGKPREMSPVFGKAYGNFNVIAERLIRQSQNFGGSQGIEDIKNWSSVLTKEEYPCQTLQTFTCTPEGPYLKTKSKREIDQPSQGWSSALNKCNACLKSK